MGGDVAVVKAGSGDSQETGKGGDVAVVKAGNGGS